MPALPDAGEIRLRLGGKCQATHRPRPGARATSLPRPRPDRIPSGAPPQLRYPAAWWFPRTSRNSGASRSGRQFAAGAAPIVIVLLPKTGPAEHRNRARLAAPAAPPARHPAPRRTSDSQHHRFRLAPVAVKVHDSLVPALEEFIDLRMVSPRDRTKPDLLRRRKQVVRIARRDLLADSSEPPGLSSGWTSGHCRAPCRRSPAQDAHSAPQVACTETPALTATMARRSAISSRKSSANHGLCSIITCVRPSARR